MGVILEILSKAFLFHLPRAKWRKEFFEQEAQKKLQPNQLDLQAGLLPLLREQQRLVQRRADMATECFDRALGVRFWSRAAVCSDCIAGMALFAACHITARPHHRG